MPNPLGERHLNFFFYVFVYADIFKEEGEMKKNDTLAQSETFSSFSLLVPLHLFDRHRRPRQVIHARQEGGGARVGP
jgi:hypothetical protein